MCPLYVSGLIGPRNDGTIVFNFVLAKLDQQLNGNCVSEILMRA
jgi:uncharacterized membrane protein YciS (DUF1049 family)